MESQYKINRLVSTYSDTILRIAYQHTGNISDSEDIAQEVFISLVKNNRSFTDKEHEKAYIIKATINKCHSFHRKKGKFDLVYLDEVYKNNEPVFTICERSLLNEILTLDKKHRDVLYLHYYEGYSAKEIANILGTTTGTVTSRLKRAREKLKVRLEDNYE